MASAKKRIRRLPYGYSPEKEWDAPEFFNGCKFWAYWEDIGTGKIFPRVCEHCDGCRMHRHEGIVGRLMAEGESAACVLSVCLTYDDNGPNPDGAVWLNYDHVATFYKALRSNGIKVRKFAAGEYGTMNGRAHWHTLNFFQWDAHHLQGWRYDFVNVDWKGQQLGQNYEAERRKNWLKFVHPLRVGRIEPKSEFVSLLADPDVLWVPTVGYKSGGDYPQKWRFWPNGHVEASILKAPGVGTDEEMNRGVRYNAKYFSKDPWKEGKLRKVEFEKLPEWIKQATAYGPWDCDGTNERTKWVRGNKYGQQIDERNLKEYASDELVPLAERRKRHRHEYKARGGLGSDYFEALGAWYANAYEGQDALVSRSFKLGPSYRKDHIEKVRELANLGVLPKRKKRNLFYMGDTAFRQFARGYNAMRLSKGGEETTGPEHVFEVLESRAAVSRDKSSGAFGWHLWNNATRSERKKLEHTWSELSNDRLAGLVPVRLQRLFEDTSKCEGWQNKRRARLQDEKRGKVKKVTHFTDWRIIETTQRRFFYEKDLRRFKDTWYGREVLTVENLDAAIAGNFLPENARAARLDNEGLGDQTELAELDIRTVRKRIAKAYSVHCPF